MNKKVLLLLFLAGVLILLFLFGIYYPYFEKFDKGYLTICFDDGYISTYNYSFPLMKEYNFKGVLYLISELNEFEGRELMSFSQAKEMQDYGWEIGSHTLTHQDLRSLNPEEAEAEIRDSKKVLEEKGFVIKSFAYPFGKYSSNLEKIVKENYLSSRIFNTFFDYNYFNTNKYRLKTKSTSIDLSAENLCSEINKANERKVWLIITFHDLNNERYWDYPKEKFKQVLDCIRDSGIKVVKISDMVK